MSPSALSVTTVPVTLRLFLTPFARHFRMKGWRIDALSNGATTERALNGVFDERFDAAWSRNPLSPSNLIGTAGRVREIVEQNGYDIVHVHTPIAAFVTRFALRKLPAKTRPAIIYTAHGFHFYPGQNPVIAAGYRSMERAAARWTDLLVTINEVDFDAARRFGTIEPDRVRLIPGIGVDIEDFSPEASDTDASRELRRELDVSDDAFVLLMVAEFGRVKRHAHLVDALTRVTSGRVVVVFVGEGPLQDRIRKQVVARHIKERVRFAGYRHDVPALLAASNALILVSEREGLPRAVLEAMAAGRPILGTATRGITDAVGEDSGWIAPKNDALALARLIDAAADNPDDVRARGIAARQRVESRFALSSIISAYEGLYDEALLSRTSRLSGRSTDKVA
ncbi:MAG: glycosyltransferase family 4 protein [Coriobacteriia bacterium]|nr:glycosyltransferase family 4 protein [Coriobacteriia bacterium]